MPARHDLDASVIGLGPACLTAFDSSWVTVIALRGTIDASNAAEVGTCLHGFVSHERALVLDLSDLDGLGAEGVESLLRLADTCDRLGVDWALVASQSSAGAGGNHCASSTERASTDQLTADLAAARLSAASTRRVLVAR
jgi:anti-anti-sigma regulatory factor